MGASVAEGNHKQRFAPTFVKDVTHEEYTTGSQQQHSTSIPIQPKYPKKIEWNVHRTFTKLNLRLHDHRPNSLTINPSRLLRKTWH